MTHLLDTQDYASLTQEDILFQQTVEKALQKQAVTSSAGVERILERRLPRFESTLVYADLWSLDSLGIEVVTAVRDAKAETQTQIREALALSRLHEAWSIERAGMTFAAKMSLLAESLNEQKLYSLFASEEANHFHFIDQCLSDHLPQGIDPFISLLNQMIASCDRRALLFMIQIVLEGWGIVHYANMSKNCSNPHLKACLQNILSDEAAHHGSGLSLFQESQLTNNEFKQIVDMMSQFLYMVAIGPVSVMRVLSEQLGPLLPHQRDQMLGEIKAFEETQIKLNLLKDLMLKANAHRIVLELEQRNAFTPSL